MALDGELIASCTYPIITPGVYRSYGDKVFSPEYYDQVIKFEVGYQFDSAETNGYIIGDLHSGNPDYYDEYVQYYVDHFDEFGSVWLDIPPWIDTENKLNTQYDENMNWYGF